jgi:hypothetical protein
MSFVIAAPQLVTAMAGADQMSAVTAALLGEHAHAYQALIAHAEAFHEQLVQTLRAAAGPYAAAEAAPPAGR